MSDVQIARVEDRQWVPTETAGLDYAVMRPNETGGATILLRFDKGVIGAAHTHPGGEEVFVISGDITIGDHRMKPGDYLYTPPDGVHEALAHEPSLILLQLPKLPVFL
jgi:quercetin dioxygenase-like cupin family protein